VRQHYTDGRFEVLVSDDDIVLVVGEPGPPGPPGTGGGGSAAYTHSQVSPNTSWVVVHNLGFRPNVYLTNGVNEIEGEVIHVSANILNVNFDTSVSGTAYLS
jgi:hypothetical protein